MTAAGGEVNGRGGIQQTLDVFQATGTKNGHINDSNNATVDQFLKF